MELLWKCAAICVTAGALGLTIRKRSEEQSFLLGLLAAVMVLGGALSAVQPVAELVRRLQSSGTLRPALVLPVIKGLGLAILGKLTEGFCKDAGQSAAASAMELATSCAILCAAVPILELLLDTVLSVL